MNNVNVKRDTLNIIVYTIVFILCYVSINNWIVDDNSKLINNTLKEKRQILKENETLITKTKKFEYDDGRNAGSNSIDAQIPHLNADYLNSISEICARYNLSTNLVKRHYLESPDNASLYCWIRKIASTSFTKLFSDLRKRRITKDYYKEVDILSPKTIDDLKSLITDDKVFKFMLIRHPFERIVSSYRDRIEDNTKYTAQAWIYAPKIFHLTRPHLFHSNKSTGSSLSRIFYNDKRLKLVPRFDEFISWLLKTPKSKDDVHWDSYYSHCSICNVNYNHIMKLENYSNKDANFILSKLGLNKNQTNIFKLEKTRNGSTDYKKTCKYLKTLSKETILKFYQRYKIDFQIFNYTYENYIRCTNLTYI